MNVASTLAGALATLVIWYSGSVLAVEPYAYTEAEKRQLPRYCQRESQAAKKLALPDSHHFCHGLKFVMRANKPGIASDVRKYNLTSAVGEFDYVLGHNGKHSNTRYLSVVSYHKASSLNLLGQKQKAMESYNRALRYNPILVAAYFNLSALYMDMSMEQEAIEQVKKGLEAVPRSKLLRRQLDKMTKK